MPRFQFTGVVPGNVRLSNGEVIAAEPGDIEDLPLATPGPLWQAVPTTTAVARRPPRHPVPRP